MSTSTARSLAELRKRGYHAERCEQWRPSMGEAQAGKYAGGHRKDLFGFMDVLAYGSGEAAVLAVQVTSRKQISTHLRKFRRDEKTRQAILDWLYHPGRRFVIHGWRKDEVPNKSRPGSHVRWVCVERWVEPEDLKGT